METFRVRETAIAAELASHRRALPAGGSPGDPTPCRSGRAAPGLGRQVIRVYCQVPPDEFTVGATAEVYDPELITVNLWR